MMEAVFDKPFDEQLSFFRQKKAKISPESWRDVWREAHARAFTVARVTALDVLSDIRQALDRAMDTGIPFKQFQKDLVPTLEGKGWMAPKGEKAVEILPDGTERKRLTGWRLRTIYQTNFAASYHVGRYKQLQAVKDERPYWQYRSQRDPSVREAHRALDGKVYHADHPFWDKWYPPNGFNCRCYVKSLSKRQMEARGLTEETQGVSIRPDEGWDYSPGRVYHLWDKQLEGGEFRERPGQQTFRDFGRPDVRDISNALRTPAPDRLPKASEIGKEAVLTEVLRVVGIQEGHDFRMVQTGDGETALLHRDRLAHILDANDGREQYAGMIVPTLEKPFEVYLTEYVNEAGYMALRKRYVGLFEDPKKLNYLVVLDQGRDGSIFWNGFIRDKNKINKSRVGTLIYAVDE